MKLLTIITGLIAITSGASAHSGFRDHVETVSCSINGGTLKQSVAVDAGGKVQVLAQHFTSGHRWSSADGIIGTIVKKAKLGGVTKVEFIIDTAKQEERSKLYSFMLRRPWERNPIAICKIKVTQHRLRI